VACASHYQCAHLMESIATGKEGAQEVATT